MDGSSFLTLNLSSTPNTSPANEVDFTVKIVVSTSCIISMAGSLLIIFTFLAWPDIRTEPRKILLYLSVADFIAAASFLHGTIQDFDVNSLDCIIQSALSTFSNVSSFFWTMNLAVYLYVTIVKVDKNRADKLMWIFHIISWGIPLVIVIAAVSSGGLGYDESYISVGWCWVDLDNELYLMWILLAGKFWEILAYISLPVLYLLMKRRIKIEAENYELLTVHQQKTVDLMLKMDKKLTLIPLIFVCLRIWSTVRFILFLCHSDVVSNVILMCLHGIGNSFQGGANAILFCFMTSRIRKKLASSCMAGAESLCAPCFNCVHAKRKSYERLDSTSRSINTKQLL